MYDPLFDGDLSAKLTNPSRKKEKKELKQLIETKKIIRQSINGTMSEAEMMRESERLILLDKIKRNEYLERYNSKYDI